MTHTVESLMSLAKTLAVRYYDMQKYHSEETVSDYQTFHNGLQSALTEVLAERDTLAKDAARWVKLCELLNEEKATVTFLGRVDTIHTGLEVFDSGDLHDEIEIAMKGTP